MHNTILLSPKEKWANKPKQDMEKYEWHTTKLCKANLKRLYTVLFHLNKIQVKATPWAY